MEPRSTGHADAVRAEQVPFVDLGFVTRPIRDDVLGDLAKLMDRGAFVNGSPVSDFESAFAAAVERGYCIGLASGLDALRLALAALDIGAGDEVLVPAMTFVATFEAVAQVGATPVPVDVRTDDVGLDVEAAAAAITARTRAILPVHLYGQMADMRGLRALAERYGLRLLEDAAQAHGASRDGLGAGSAGDAAAFSFYPSKNLGAMGDAGALVTGDEALARRVRALREHGETSKYRSDFVGWTARLDAMQAVVLTHKLPFLDEWNEQRRQAALAYHETLAGVGDFQLPTEVSGAHHVWHLYTVRTADPGALAKSLRGRGVATGRHYPEPPHLSGAFSSLGYTAGSFPVAESVARETLSLPIYPGITTQQIEHVAGAIRAFFAHG
jgi:dTDP-4-amino-4,6-dideoxygalactose transaminase